MSLYIKNHASTNDRVIAVINGGDLDGNVLCVSDKPGTEAITIPMEASFKFVPELRDRIAQHVHIVGPSGCGKSTTCQDFVDNFPGKSIVVSADEDEDPALSNIGLRLKACEDMGKIDIEDLKCPDGLMVIFDDIEGVDRPIEKALNIFKRALHERGRKYNICTINVYHRGADGQNTRTSLSEMTHLVIFPRFCNNQNTKYLLTRYAGLPDNICDLLTGPQWGRRVLIGINTVPQYIVGEHAAAILNHTTILALAKHARKLRAKSIASAII